MQNREENGSGKMVDVGIVFQKMEISKESFEDRLICQKKIFQNGLLV